MGRPRKYTPASLRRETERYFRSISRKKVLTEPVPTGERDEYGHPVMRQQPIISDAGEPVTVTEWIVPPSVEDLTLFLGIGHQTWANYCDPKKHPEFVDTIARTQGRLRAWNVRELLTRPGKDVRGIEFNLKNNYGFTERSEIELGEHAQQAVTTAGMSLEDRAALLAAMIAQERDEDAD